MIKSWNRKRAWCVPVAYSQLPAPLRKGSVSNSFTAVVLNQGKFQLLGNIWQCLETFFGYPNGEGATGIQWVEARDAAKHPATHSTAPPPPHTATKNKEMSTLAEVEKPYLTDNRHKDL